MSREIAEEYNTFSVLTEKEIRKIDESSKENALITSYKINLIDSVIFMVSSSSNLVDHFADGIHKNKFKYGHDMKKWETFEIKYKDCGYYFEYTNAKNDLIDYKCLCWNKSYQNKFDENLKKRFPNT